MEELHFRSDSTYKIVQFTDIRWESDIPANIITLGTMAAILDNEKQDLLVLLCKLNREHV